MLSLKGKSAITILMTLLLLVTPILDKNIKATNTAVIDPDEIKSSPLAVVIRKNELNLVNLKNIAISKMDDGGTFSRPIISPGKKYVAFLKNNTLNIAEVLGKKFKIHDDISMESYTWLNDYALIYSLNTGGLYIFDTKRMESKPYVSNKYNYKNIIIDSEGKIYAEKYFYYTKEGSQYVTDYGIVSFSPDTKQEELIIKSIPMNPSGTGLGMYPVITGISEDRSFLYILEFPHSASMAADGVGLASYNTKTKKYQSYNNIITLAYRDNLSSSAAAVNEIALIGGGGREMKSGKVLGLLNLVNGRFEKLSPNNQAAMTPCFSKDGKSILYAASQQGTSSEGTTEWMKKGNHNIYNIDIQTKKLSQLTISGKSFDFSPVCLNKSAFAFFRSDLKNNISMWKLENGKETKIIDGLVFSTDMQYPVQDYYGHYETYNFVDIKQ